MDKGRLKKLKTYHVIFLVQNSMIGLGLLSLVNDLSPLGNNQWIAPLLLGVIASILLYPMVQLCRKFPDDSLFVIHERVLGKWLGKIMNALFTIYAITSVASVFEGYLRLIQVVTLPDHTILPGSIYSFIVLVLIVYGGIKSVARFNMLSFFFTGWMVVFLVWPFSKGYFIDALPRFDTSYTEWGEALFLGGHSMLGFELIMIYFPYIYNQQKAYRDSVIGVWITVMFYVLVSFTSVMYFSTWQMEHLLYPLLNIYQSVQLAFIERIETFGLTLWIFLIMSTTSVYLWAAKRGLDSLLSNHKNRTWHLYFLAIVALLVFLGPIPRTIQTKIFDEWSVYTGYGFLVWPIILLLIYKIRKKWAKPKGLGRKTAGFLVLLLFLSGCAIIDTERPSLEDYGFVEVMGFDLADEDQIRITYTLPQPNPKAESHTQIFSMNAKLAHEGIMKFSAQSEKLMTTSQLRVILFSEELARKRGVKEIIFTLYRDAQIGPNIRIAVVKGNEVEKILRKKFKDKPDVSSYIPELLKPREGIAFNPFTSVHDFVYRLTDNVSDPSVPYIEERGDSIEITKVALFKEAMMVSTVVPEEAKILEALKKKKKLPDMEIEVNEAIGGKKETKIAILKFVESKFNVDVNQDSEKLNLHVSLYVRGVVVDYNGEANLGLEEGRKQLEKEIEEAVDKKLIQLLHEFQEKEIDPIGLGRHARAKSKGEWTKEMWINKFKKAEVSSHVKATIISTGTLK
ncbi:Ger(x)C family spore germination protein [Caldalkalibacillus mannanilyticus]|uniref:Ger(x)C family spore germination protein n=1 Tax=Caldalkalibacillus mannanilyticus TaxID=1418 RepID=UPI00046826C5|nr:Ger(x)C family spore germination protein [Caldalkalibacillus mannanilyticus]